MHAFGVGLVLKAPVQRADDQVVFGLVKTHVKAEVVFIAADQATFRVDLLSCDFMFHGRISPFLYDSMILPILQGFKLTNLGRFCIIKA